MSTLNIPSVIVESKSRLYTFGDMPSCGTLLPLGDVPENPYAKVLPKFGLVFAQCGQLNHPSSVSVGYFRNISGPGSGVWYENCGFPVRACAVPSNTVSIGASCSTNPYDYIRFTRGSGNRAGQNTCTSPCPVAPIVSSSSVTSFSITRAIETFSHNGLTINFNWTKIVEATCGGAMVTSCRQCNTINPLPTRNVENSGDCEYFQVYKNAVYATVTITEYYPYSLGHSYISSDPIALVTVYYIYEFGGDEVCPRPLAANEWTNDHVLWRGNACFCSSCDCACFSVCGGSSTPYYSGSSPGCDCNARYEMCVFSDSRNRKIRIDGRTAYLKEAGRADRSFPIPVPGGKTFYTCDAWEAQGSFEGVALYGDGAVSGQTNLAPGGLMLFGFSPNFSDWSMMDISFGEKYDYVTSARHNNRLVVLATRGCTWYVIVGTMNGSGSYSFSTRRVLSITGTSVIGCKGNLIARADGVLEFSYVDQSSNWRIAECRTLSNNGSGTWS